MCSAAAERSLAGPEPSLAAAGRCGAHPHARPRVADAGRRRSPCMSRLPRRPGAMCRPHRAGNAPPLCCRSGCRPPARRAGPSTRAPRRILPARDRLASICCRFRSYCHKGYVGSAATGGTIVLQAYAVPQRSRLPPVTSTATSWPPPGVKDPVPLENRILALAWVFPVFRRLARSRWSGRSGPVFGGPATCRGPPW
jgi:hypothetical protein